MNNPSEVMLAQARENLSRDLPMLIPQAARKGSARIVAGGPSLDPAEVRRGRGPLFCVNGTFDWLIGRGIVPDYHVLLDTRADNVGFVSRPRDDVRYLVAAQCHPCIFDALEGRQVTMWVAAMPGMETVTQEHPDRPIVAIGGGSTVGLKTLCIAYTLGFRRLDLHGFDSCYSGLRNHAYDQPLNDCEKTRSVSCMGRQFRASEWMLRQAEDFQNDARSLEALGCYLKVHGDGLIPWITLKAKEHAIRARSSHAASR